MKSELIPVVYLINH